MPRNSYLVSVNHPSTGYFIFRFWYRSGQGLDNSVALPPGSFYYQVSSTQPDAYVDLMSSSSVAVLRVEDSVTNNDLPTVFNLNPDFFNFDFGQRDSTEE